MPYQYYMQRAIELAKRGLYSTAPNPRVGCVIVNDNHILGEGFHERTGLPHAEINALNDVAENGHSAKNATAYVTLEPCSHYGRTPPCADALIAAEVAHVVIGSRDPNPQVRGRGIAKLRQAGIKVTTEVLSAECDALNVGFLKRMTTGLPYVRIKLGMSLDAKIATASGKSQWITGDAARADVQHLRAQSCVVMTSSSTVMADNPSLNVRLANVVRQPKRVIVDSQLRVPAEAKIFALPGEVLIYHCSDGACLQQRAETVTVPEKKGHADLQAILRDLGKNHQCNEVLVEAGGRFAAALIVADLVDELIIYQAPMLLGHHAKPAFALPGIDKISEAWRFSITDCAIIGDDMKWIMRKH